MRTENLLKENRSLNVRRYRGWWWRTLLRTALSVGVGIFLIYALGQAQRWGWIRTAAGPSAAASGKSDEVYTCPMHPHIRMPTPGRCPECGMALEKAGAKGKHDPIAVTIDPVARRLANIRTAAVEKKKVEHLIRAPGTLAWDETRVETIISYVAGRIEEQYADFTGFDIAKKSKLVKIFSPHLEAAQVAWIESRRTLTTLKQSGVQSAIRAQEELISQARRQLSELGMTKAQIAQLEITGEIQSRIILYSTVAGTVIEKLVSRGDEVKAGQALYRIASRDVVWLKLDLFPDDAARIDLGQSVGVTVTSLPGKKFEGKVSFIAPEVDPMTRTVPVRVEMKNPKQQLRPGDLARAEIRVPVTGEKSSESLVVPRSALLHVGETSIVYVETKPGRFEIRPVKLATMTKDHAVLLEGVKPGDQVATAGNFLIDSQMQIEGKPSLIDTSKYVPDPEGTKIENALAALPEKDREAAKRQKTCPVTKMPLGSMGVPMKMEVKGQEVFICCEGCSRQLKRRPEKYLPLQNRDQ